MDKVERPPGRRRSGCICAKQGPVTTSLGSPGGLHHMVPQSRRLPRARPEQERAQGTGFLINTGESCTGLHFRKLILQAAWKH